MKVTKMRGNDEEISSNAGYSSKIKLKAPMHSTNVVFSSSKSKAFDGERPEKQ